MPRKKEKTSFAIGEDTRIAVNLTIKKLMETEDQKELEFPSSYTAEERAYVHDLARKLGLKSKSRGKGANRFLTVYKREGSTIVQEDAWIKLETVARQGIYNLIQQFPLDPKERRDLLPPTERERTAEDDLINNSSSKSTARLTKNIAQIPQLRTNYEVLNMRNSLPVSAKRAEILQALTTNQVVIICGDTGCGKTTQVPQFILEHHQQKRQPCNIICTQPRRLAAVSVAERVAYERDEKVGQTIGYQIRLESRHAVKTILTYCTNGVLLRTLMAGDSALDKITHVIVDEVHERDRFCDFLLISLKDALAKYKSLRLVLMSATMETSIFAKYFNTSSIVSIPDRSYEVDVFFLEDILRFTCYKTKEMARKKAELMNKKEQMKVLESWTQESSQPQNQQKGKNKHPLPLLSHQNNTVPEKNELEPWLAREMDHLIEQAWLQGEESDFSQLLHLILSENVSVDYQHSHTCVTALMVAAGRGHIDVVEQLLNLGANLNIKAGNEWTALDWAKHRNKTDCIELIEAYAKSLNCPLTEAEFIAANAAKLSDNDKLLLDSYHQTFNDDNVDYNLLLTLILYIHLKKPAGAILVFLPGYDDIVTMRERIISEKAMGQEMRYNLFMLHSNMQSSEQMRVFKPSHHGTRKIILSTNIAETSITIEDVVYVIDSGKVKEKSFDAIANICMLKSNWISQACAKQRKGRAGRCQKGVCYRLYSTVRYNSMEPHQTPEMLRLPLQELCLFTKHLAPVNTTIAEYLDRAIQPPSNIVTRNAVQLLKTIDALDSWEDLTELGSHLLDLPIEPRLGKMLLYAVVLKCLDPILTIVCLLAHKDPFILPSQPSEKRAVTVIRRKFAANSFSDHMALLRAFQGWQDARESKRERMYCEKNFISSAVLEMVVGMRSQLLGQLRASGFVRSRGSGDIRDINTNSENWAVVKAALTAGLYPNLIRVDREHLHLRTQREVKVFFHPSSTLRNDFAKSPKTNYTQTHAGNVGELPSNWMIYEEMSRSGKLCHVKTVTAVNPLTVALFSGPARLPMEIICEAESVLESESDSEEEDGHKGSTILKLDDWVVFKLDNEAARLILHLRQKWNALFMRRMINPSKPMTAQEEQVVRTLVAVLTTEERASGLQQPSGIGQRPRPLILDYYPANARRVDEC